MHPTRCVGVHLAESHCSQFKNGELLPETLEPTRQRFYEILDFLPHLKKERTFSIPAVLNPQKSLRKAQSKGRKRLAGLRARGQSARRLSSGRPVVESVGGGHSGVATATRKPRTLAETIAGNFSTKNLSVAPHGQPLSVSPQCFPDVTVGVMGE